MSYTANAIYGSTGQRTMAYGFDLSDLKPTCALGETPVVSKEVILDTKVYTVSQLLTSTFGLKYDLILNMMLRDGTVQADTKIRVGSTGRLREVFLVKEKEAYRIFGKTYYGKV